MRMSYIYCRRNLYLAENRNTPGGTFDVGNNTYSLRVEGEFKAVSYTHLDVYKRQM